ncbi:MAG: hypothetical protein JO199_11830 [Candidatus Eremiobacteraeota bacterium]|nr:hypothetical protein [Candidatus Eremiobacteraeota bacterium]
MATIKTIEEQIFSKEGFRVKLLPFEGKAKSLPAYDYEYMASNRWTVADWQAQRMARYIAEIRAVEVYRGDGERAKTTLKLARLRDSYFDAFCS